ncbi:unnamed protein product [Allacma fusca]|uniref:Uncharacterized protein n=1 Tax=Allacma fusca TaxID=39272 RepID=A0A8J2PBG6_9HEXA|nr:unnamed protein product [Allacma fusca]
MDVVENLFKTITGIHCSPTNELPSSPKLGTPTLSSKDVACCCLERSCSWPYWKNILILLEPNQTKAEY